MSAVPEPPQESAPARRRRHETVHAWAGTVAGLVALALSAYNFLALHREPEVDVRLPHIVRIAQGKDVWLYLQPTLSTRFKAEQAEVITQAELRMRATARRAKAPAFFWDETGAFSYDAARQELTYQRAADPGPLLIDQDTPNQPLMLFNAVGWNFRPGRYEGTLRLHRSGGRAPLDRDFCLLVSPEAATAFREAGQFTFRDFRDDVPGAGPRSARGCYTLSPV
ncbi:hypothetical protein LRS74_07115 [Streptomyces sp. LX-29]|uniref:hypothetical protein n=1 Tax=Streptomyces sp. LX-29 TaxID=2900152 RepID=UPI00240E52C1|nr:hypothetical protein [Streptomyces sp. LX-29]WFB06837.1 hypothetical protein LRS74_07115 [Streptomyces sp. LX-29]